MTSQPTITAMIVTSGLAPVVDTAAVDTAAAFTETLRVPVSRREKHNKELEMKSRVSNKKTAAVFQRAAGNY
jgi:hypothetical protein